MQIENNGPEITTLVSIKSPVYTRIEIHESVRNVDVATMEPVSRLDIAPGTHLTFAPGGLHLMIYNTGKPPQSGETIPLTLQFADGTTGLANAIVKKMSDHSQHQNHVQSSGDEPTLLAKARVGWQYLLPQHTLSALMYRLTRTEWEPLRNFLIRNFIRLYDVDMSIAVRPEAEQYRHFNDFFTRTLKADARPVDPAADAIVSPVDGTVSQYGRIDEGRLLQAKGHYFTATELLGGNTALGERFRNGEFVTLYLSPRDYHRIHMPISGTLESMSYVPGDLFSVNPATTQAVDNLFARNERVIQVFATPIGKVALIMVGAIFVGSMETVWAGEITPATERQPYTRDYTASGQQIRLEKGAEMGRFNMGSTVILLFEPGKISWESFIGSDQGVKLGQKIATTGPG